MRSRLNELLDSLPCTEVRLDRELVPVWRVAAVVGGFGAVFVCIPLAAAVGMPMHAFIAATVASAVAYLAMTRVKNWLGRNQHILFEALAVGLAAAVPVYWAAGVDPLRGLDVHMAGFAALASCGRVGCVMNGCCYGVAGSVGILYPPARDRPAARRIPVQVLDGAIWLALVPIGVLLTLFCGSGVAAGALLVVCSFARIGIERLRDDPRPRWRGLTEAGWLTGPLLLCGVAIVDRDSGWQLVCFLAPVLVVIVGLWSTTDRWLGPQRVVTPAAQAALAAAALELARSCPSTHEAGWEAERRVGDVLVGMRAEESSLIVWVARPGDQISRAAAGICLEAVLRGMGVAAADPHSADLGDGRRGVRLRRGKPGTENLGKYPYGERSDSGR